MKLTLAPSATIATVAGTQLRCRLWKGVDELGTPVHAYVLAVSPQTNDPVRTHAYETALEPREGDDISHLPQAIDLRFVL